MADFFANVIMSSTIYNKKTKINFGSSNGLSCVKQKKTTKAYSPSCTIQTN